MFEDLVDFVCPEGMFSEGLLAHLEFVARDYVALDDYLEVLGNVEFVFGDALGGAFLRSCY